MTITLQRSLLLTICFLAHFMPVCSQNVAKGNTNIILLFSDDAGYRDFGFQGSKTFKTPNLDRLAKDGMIFKQAYTTAAVCGPSRAGLLSGQYQQRFGFEENNVPGFMSESSKLLGDEMGMPEHIKMIPAYLPNHYKSIVIGKWHMGNADKYHPLHKGFDEFYGLRGGARSFWPLSQKDAFERPDNRLERGFKDYQEPDKYLTYDLAEEACDFIARHQKKTFFMYMSFTAVHSPMQATDEDLAAVDAMNLGLTGKRRVLAAMTLALDRGCGMILDKLKELGLEQNTLVIFSNDNGGPDGTETCNYPLSGCKSNNLEGGIRVPMIMKWPGVVKPGTAYEHPVSTLDFLPTFVNAAGGDAATIKGLDGVDLRPYVTGDNKDRPHEVLFWKKENRGMVRLGDYKLLRFPDRPAELYNIAQDEEEKYNLAAKQPERVREMFKILWEWESELERPLFMLKRVYEVNAMKRMDEKRDPVLDAMDIP